MPVRQPHLGLEIQLDLFALDGATQIAEHGEAVGGVAVVVGGVSLDAAASFLRYVHGHVGSLHQLIEVSGVIGEDRDTYTGLDLEDDRLKAHRFGERGPQPRRDLSRQPRFLHRGQQHGELVTAQPGHYVTRADAVG